METRMCGACGRPIVDGAPFFPSEPPIHMYEGGCAAALRAALTAAKTALAEERSKREEAEAKLDDAEAAERFAMKYGHEVEKERARADRAEAALAEALDGREKVTAFDLMKRGGEWLGAARSWLQRHARNGDRVTWGSDDTIEHRFSVREIEDMAAEVAAAAMRPQPSDERLTTSLKARWRAERALATARSDALRAAAGVPSKVIDELRRRGLLTIGDESVARSIESGILALLGEGVGS